MRPPSRIAKRRPSSIAIGVNEISRDGYVVARHNHFGALGEMCNTGDVGGAEVELRTITIEERSMTAAFFLGKDVNLTLKFLCEELQNRACREPGHAGCPHA